MQYFGDDENLTVGLKNLGHS